MSKLSKFIGQAKDVTIRGEILKLYPLTIQEMGTLDRLGEISKKAEKTNEDNSEILSLGIKLIKSAFKDENFTDEELTLMDLDLYTELFVTMVESISEMKDGKGIARIRELKEKTIQQGK